MEAAKDSRRAAVAWRGGIAAKPQWLEIARSNFQLPSIPRTGRDHHGIRLTEFSYRRHGWILVALISPRSRPPCRPSAINCHRSIARRRVGVFRSALRAQYSDLLAHRDSVVGPMDHWIFEGQPA